MRLFGRGDKRERLCWVDGTTERRSAMAQEQTFWYRRDVSSVSWGCR